MSSRPWMRTRWRQGGSAHDDLSFWCGAAVLFVYFGGVRDYAAQRAEDDAPVRGLLLRHVRRGHDCGELGDVSDQALGLDSKFDFQDSISRIRFEDWDKK